MSLLRTRRVYTGRVINLDIDTVVFPDGSGGELEMIRHSGAAAVLPLLDPLDAPDPRVVLLRQFRHAADGYVWEIPAGRLEKDEAPETCAGRELEEEAGFTAATLMPLTTVYTTPGFTDERIHLFVALHLTPTPHRREPDEFMETHTLPWSQVLDRCRKGDIQDGKTLSAIMFVQCLLR